jgi:hypothetical protein
MKFNFNYLLMTVCGIALLTSSAFAQRGVQKEYASPLDPSAKPTPIYIGPAFGFNIMGHSMDIPTFVNDKLCPNFKNASGIGILGGLTLEYLFGDVASSSSSLIFRALFNMYPGSVTVEDKDYPTMDLSGNVLLCGVENTMDITYNAATFEVMYKINPIPGFGLGIVVGPAFDYIITKDRTHKFSLTKPLNAQFDPEKIWPEGTTFDPNKRTATIYDGEIEDASTIRLGLKAGVQYEILLGSKLYIAPSLAYNFGITSLSSAHTWRVSPIQIALDARFAF